MTVLKTGDRSARVVSQRIGEPCATDAAMKAIPASSRVHGMLVLQTTSGDLWRVDTASAATAGPDVLAFDAGAGRLIRTAAVGGDAAGTSLTNAGTQTIQATEGSWRKLPTLGQNGVLTLGTTGAVAGDQITITRTDLSAFTYAIVNGGAGAGTLATFPVSKLASAMVQFDGTNWALRLIGQLA